jgi:beta-glucanase (GH16 family)
MFAPELSQPPRLLAALPRVLLPLALCGCGSDRDLVLGRNEFVLERRDEFDTLDLEYWEVASHTFDANLAWFSERHASIDAGTLVLTVAPHPDPPAAIAGEPPRAYAAAELKTRMPFLYGRFRARARLAPGSGVVSSFWGFYDRYTMNSGAELDNQIVIESSGAPDHPMRYIVAGPEAAPEPFTLPAPADPSAAFHELGFDWRPHEVRFYFDGAVRAVVNGPAAAALSESQRLVLSAYPSRAPWAGAFDDSVLPVSAVFDWVEIHSYVGPRP